MSVNFNENYITVFATNFSYCYNVFTYWTTRQLEEWVYKTKMKDVHKLWQHTVDEWDKLDRHIIDKTIGEWQKRLWACVAVGGGQFEHEMWTFLISDVLSSDIFER